MNTRVRGLIAVAAGMMVSGCVTLSEEANAVREVNGVNDVAECRALGEVIANPPFALPTDATNTLKNETARLGGNALFITKFFYGPAKGQAYAC
ncbi:MAG: hypothetical protein JKY63_05020 [Rhodobiaceae bacterium]|nr:hypothetical protein [Rhodobiaceae bacterium]